VGNRRWAATAPAAPWNGTRAAHEPGPIAPQGAAPLAPVTGPMRAAPAREDCLTLDLWSPSPDPAARLPVLVFIHGGGYLSGAGSAAWYDGARLARRGPAVVVNVTYRLGALGFLQLPSSVTGGEPTANLALQDLLAALEWVAANAERFGGDPGRVTLLGQSVGAHAVACLAAVPRAAALFQRAILQSGPFGSPALSSAEAGDLTTHFLDELAMPDATLETLRELPVERILAAQHAVLMRSIRFGSLDPPFRPVVDGTLLSEEPLARMAETLAPHDLLLGFTAHESRAFFFNPALWGRSVWDCSAEELIAWARGVGDERLAALLPAYIAHGEAGRPAAAALCDLVSDDAIVADTVALAAERAERGRPAYLYELGWAPTGAEGRLGACHAIDLPLVFGTIDDWTDSAMLGPHAGASARELSDRMQDAWLAFAADGDPGCRSLPEWTPCEGRELHAMRLDLECGMTREIAEGRRELWAGARRAP
jgi:para-nitrobenzyl esterase